MNIFDKLKRKLPGWREGFTKQTIKKRKATRRAKNKVARKSRRVNRMNT